jgi:O-antigen/teichoic acid export membrane protein
MRQWHLITSSQGLRPADRFAGVIVLTRTLWDEHRVMITNSAALAAGAAATAVLGFLFWWAAARLFTPHAVGLGSAAVLLMTLVALAGELSLGTLLTGESLRRPKEARQLISAALVVALATSSFLAFVYASTIHLVFASPQEQGIPVPLFTVGCGLAGFALVLDHAFVGLLRSTLQMARNGLFSALKLALLIAAGFAVTSENQETLIFAAWTAGQLLSIVIVVAVLAARGKALWARPDFSLLWRLAPNVLRHHLLNLATLAPGLILPSLVTVILSAEANAAFFACWMIMNVILLVPGSLTTILFAMGSVEPERIRHRLRLSFAICLLTSVVAAVALLIGSRYLLGLFGPLYASLGGPALPVLGLVILPAAVKAHYVAVQRLGDRMGAATPILGAGAVLEVVAAAAGGRVDGLVGFAAGWVIAIYIEAAVLAPVVARAAGLRLPNLAISRLW